MHKSGNSPCVHLHRYGKRARRTVALQLEVALGSLEVTETAVGLGYCSSLQLDRCQELVTHQLTIPDNCLIPFLTTTSLIEW